MIVFPTVGPIKSFTIASGVDGSTTDPVDLEGNYEYVRVSCADVSNIQASTDMTAQVGYTNGDAMGDLYETDDPSTQWSKTIPAGSFSIVLTHARFARRVRLVLSKVTSGGSAVFTIQGFNKGA